MNSRAEEEQHKMRARKQCFHPIASLSAHTSFRTVWPLFFFSPTPIINRHQSTATSKDCQFIDQVCCYLVVGVSYQLQFSRPFDSNFKGEAWACQMPKKYQCPNAKHLMCEANRTPVR